MIRKIFVLACIFSVIGVFAEEEDSKGKKVNYEAPAIQIHESKPDESSAKQVNEQPPIQVFSRPLSPQEKLTRARQNAEQATEDKIKTQLEVIRLKNEQKMLEQVMSPLEQGPGAVHKAPQQKAEIPVRMAEEKPPSFFVHLGVGTLNYYRIARNSLVPVGQVWNGGLGVYEGDNFSAEYVYSRAKHRLHYVRRTQPQSYFYPTQYMTHHSHSVVLKYYFLKRYTKFKPFIGATASFAHRIYSTQQDELRKQQSIHLSIHQWDWDGRRSNTWYGGGSLGIEMRISNRIVLGFEGQFYVNVHDLQDQWSNNRSSYYYTNFYEKLLEDLMWWKTQAFLRLRF